MRRTSYILYFIFLTLLSCQQESEFSGGNRVRGAQPNPPATEEEPTPEAPTETSPTQERQMLEQTFSTGQWQNAQMRFTGSFKEVVTSLQMAQEVETQQRNIYQQTRPELSRNLRQGSLGERVTQELNQVNLGVLDILLVVDNSGSMAEEQAELAGKLEPLISAVAGSDWRIGLTTTDTKRPCVEKVFYHNSPDVAAAFQKAVKGLGTKGSGKEQGIRKAVDLLGCQDMQWIRSNSNIAVLLVSDEDNCSNGRGCGNGPDSKAQFLISALAEAPHSRNIGSSAKVYGLYHIPGTECSSAYNIANVYHEAVTASSGVSGSICDSSYEGTLLSISKDMLNSLIQQFPLLKTPQTDSMEVRINGELVPANSYRVDGDHIIFVEPPTQDALIELSYLHGDNTLTQSFPLETGIDQSTLKVAMAGAMVDSDQYELQPDGTLYFFEAPPELADIIVSYKKETGLLTDFAIGELKGTPVVWVNGEVQKDGYTYDAENQAIHFTSPPPDGAQITVQFSSLGDPILSYPLQYPADLLSQVAVHVEGHPEQAVNYELNGQELRLDQESFLADATLIVTFTLKEEGIQEVPMPFEPFNDEWTFSQLPESCTPEQIRITHGEGRTTFLALDCALGADDIVELSYPYSLDFRNAFPLEGLGDQEAEITVQIDGIETHDFIRHGEVITITGPLKPGQKVTIQALP